MPDNPDRIQNGPQILCRYCGAISNHLSGLCAKCRGDQWSTTSRSLPMVMIERVAQAIADEYALVTGGRIATRNVRRCAARAIEAMREPTAAMMAAAVEPLAEVNAIVSFNAARRGGDGLTYKDGKPPLWHAWQAMIGAALKGDP